uniref:Uncharacterized protein n=1 Tax=Physcomitrium patens TaxID=3218 RepID=A0A2K1KHM7_PHYPA|nr:hypothetical protein PHYPA_009660 [Physcomitrium patens]
MLSIDNIGIKFKRSKCHQCTSTVDDYPCPPNPRAYTACCDVACNDIPNYAPHIDPLANNFVSFFHSSVNLDDDGGDPNGDSAGLTGDGYYACLMSLSLDDNFYNATHLALE